MDSTRARPVGVRPLALTMIPALLACVVVPVPAPTQFQAIFDRTRAKSGLLDLRVEAAAGRVWLALPAPGDDEGNGFLGELLYVESLVTGLGSNPVGLDRGQLGPSRVVALRIVGGRLLIDERNLSFRADSADPHEVAAVEESFASSVLWAGPIEATAADGRRLVDITSFVVRDAHQISARLEQTKQGTYTLARDRSVVDVDRVLAFPDNVELEAVLTFQSKIPGAEVEATAANGTTFSVVVRHSFIRLPDDGYTPRPFHPRAGVFAIEYADYAAPLSGPVVKQWIVRHRLPADRPLIYYVDRAVPEPVRSALIDGASWWADAFAAAGHPGKFKVEVLPEDAHPLDVRYNVIQWVHRATRGWSYGFGIIDPRTGERIKGHVSLGSLRVRQDRLLFEGLLGADKTGTGRPDDPVQLALARIRQLAAHEVGHALGFAHNFAASTYGRASVMDYPAPLVTLDGDRFDVSQAYGVGVGAWDKMATRYAYENFEDEAAGLVGILMEAQAEGYLFLSDADARPPGAAMPLANLWDNGSDPTEALRDTMKVRAAAIARFGSRNLAPGRSLSDLEAVFAPVYFHHRYQLEAAVKSVGGLRYDYPLGDYAPPAPAPVRPVASTRQSRALTAVLATLAPAALDVPERVLELLAPPAFGDGGGRERFRSRTAPGFDALGAARTAAGMTVGLLLRPERLARLVDQHRRDADQLSLRAVLDALIQTAFSRARLSRRLDPIRREVQEAVVDGLIATAVNPRAPLRVRDEVEQTLDRLAKGRATRSATVRRIRRFLGRPVGQSHPTPALAPPPGAPIGCSAGPEWTAP